MHSPGICPQAAGCRMRNSYPNREDKRLMKPVIEKRRRDRINQSLEHLRTLLLEATHDETLKNPKAEKADILKKTVHFLKMCHNPVPSDGKKLLSGFKGGFREGLNQATSFLNSADSICQKKKEYVVQRLCQHMEQQTQKHCHDSAQDVSSRVNQRQILPSPPLISRVTGNGLEQSPETQTSRPPHSHHPSPSSSFRTPCMGQEQQQTPPQTFQANTNKKPTQRTLFPPTSSSVNSALVWRPWP
ncbi:transcription factor HES-7.1-A [Xenopus tropicalis]|nr:transcription factor HES-7.1-A [Xenopus tropicalis]AAY51786.1 ESR4 [Xenopus tropicalis]|eukprot:XP_002942675.1 PREDICTED: transcription factor HES-7.1-A [Xenopus tropicalis]